jgi:hypothetical protein
LVAGAVVAIVAAADAVEVREHPLEVEADATSRGGLPSRLTKRNRIRMPTEKHGGGVICVTKGKARTASLMTQTVVFLVRSMTRISVPLLLLQPLLPVIWPRAMFWTFN